MKAFCYGKRFPKKMLYWTIPAFLIVALFIFAIYKTVDFPHVRMFITK